MGKHHGSAATVFSPGLHWDTNQHNEDKQGMKERETAPNKIIKMLETQKIETEKDRQTDRQTDRTV